MLSCVGDAPRDNPLESGNGLTIRGKIHTYYAPHLPLEMVPVYLKNLHLFTFSDASGMFEFTHLKPDSYLVITGGANFSRDSVKLYLKKNTILNFYLDRLPQFQEIKITSHHQAHWFPVEDSYFLQIFVKLTDADGIGDLNLVYFEIPEMSIADTLLPGQNPGEFYFSRNANDFAINHLEELIGKEFLITAQDDAGFSSTTQPVYLARIINESVQLISPIGFQTITSDTIHFQWQAAYLSFPFHYRLEIFQINNGVLSTVKMIDQLPANLPVLDFIHQLPSGDYLWRIYIVDEFGNTSSSKEGAFKIP